MGTFDFLSDWRARSVDERLRKRLVQYVIKSLTDKNGRVRAEDSICLAATIVGERCIDAAGDFQLRSHNMVPGSRVFSNKANTWINGDLPSTEWNKFPRESILGCLRSKLDPKMYGADNLPDVVEVFKGFAAGIGKKTDWGKVPLSVPKDNQPFVMPLQVGYESRAFVDGLFAPISGDKPRCLRIATEALGELLNLTSKAFSPKTALLLAIEMINGMAKTAPMTKEALARVQPVTGGPSAK